MIGVPLVVAPGWVRTDMGGSAARLSIEESIPLVVSMVEANRGKPRLALPRSLQQAIALVGGGARPSAGAKGKAENRSKTKQLPQPDQSHPETAAYIVRAAQRFVNGSPSSDAVTNLNHALDG